MTIHQHGMNCSWFDPEIGCTCGLEWRLKLEERDARIAELEADNARLRAALGRCMDILRWAYGEIEKCDSYAGTPPAFYENTIRHVATLARPCLSDPDGSAALEELERLRREASGNKAAWELTNKGLESACEQMHEMKQELRRLNAAGEGR